MAQTIFTIAVTTDDGEVDKSGAAYPPSSAANVSTAGAGIDARKRLVDTTYASKVVLLRFDTSSLGAGATVTGASLNLEVAATLYADGRSLNCEWIADGAIVAGDYADLVGTTGFAVAISTIAIANVGFNLTTPTNVSVTGYTKLRLGISGGAPTGENEVTLYSFAGTEPQRPKLTVDYTPAAVVAPTLRTVRSNLRLA